MSAVIYHFFDTANDSINVFPHNNQNYSINFLQAQLRQRFVFRNIVTSSQTFLTTGSDAMPCGDVHPWKFLLHNLTVASQIMEALADIFEFIHQLCKLFRINRCIQIQVEHEFKIPVRKGTAFQFVQVDSQCVKS